MTNDEILAEFEERFCHHQPPRLYGKGDEAKAFLLQKLQEAREDEAKRQRQILKESRPFMQETAIREERQHIREAVKALKRKSDSSTYLYGRGESNAYKEVLSLLDEGGKGEV